MFYIFFPKNFRLYFFSFYLKLLMYQKLKTMFIKQGIKLKKILNLSKN